MEPTKDCKFVYLFLSILCFIGCSSSPEALSRRPNMIVILCDDLGYGDLGSYGHPQIRTPNLDLLAKEGLKLTTCYSAAPVCSPSRAGLLTGRIPDRTGIYNWIPNGHPMHLPTEEVTIATILQGAGYQTALFGKWHLNGQFNQSTQPQPHDHGFQYWFSTQNNASPSHENPSNFVRNGQEVGSLTGFSCQIVVKEALSWLAQERKEEQPFFMYVCFHEPHEPVASPTELVDSYPEAENEDQAQYFANVTNMDSAVGQFIKGLKELNLYNDSYIVFTSDNGPETLNRYKNAYRSYGSPGDLRGMKLHLYEGGIRVPGIMRWPEKIPGGTVSNEPVSSLDLFPTFCQAAGVEVPDSIALDGTSLYPLFNAEPLIRTQPLYWKYFAALGEPRTAIRTNSLKLLGISTITQSEGSVPALDEAGMQAIKSEQITDWEGYYLISDTKEQRNIFDSTDQQQLVLKRTAEELFQSIQSEGPVWSFPPTSSIE